MRNYSPAVVLLAALALLGIKNLPAPAPPGRGATCPLG